MFILKRKDWLIIMKITLTLFCFFYNDKWKITETRKFQFRYFSDFFLRYSLNQKQIEDKIILVVELDKRP